MVSLPPPSPQPTPEPAPESGLNTLGRKAGKAVAITLAIPLRAVGYLSKTAACAATISRKTGATYIASGVTRVAASALNIACKAVQGGLERAEKGEYIRRVAPHVNAIAQEQISRSVHLRALRGEQLQEGAAIGQRAVQGIGDAVAGAASGLAGAAAGAGLAPIAAGAAAVAKGAAIAQAVANGTIEAVRTGERIERAASAKNSWFYQRYYANVVDLTTNLAPAILGGVKLLAGKGEQLTGWVARQAASGMDASAATEEALYNIADRADATAFWMMQHFSAPETAQPQLGAKNQQERPKLKEITQDRIETFRMLPRDVQEEMLFLVQESESWGCSKKEKAELAAAIQELRAEDGDMLKAEATIKKLLAIHDSLQPNEKQKFTPRLFHGLDELTKIHFIQIVRDHAKDLSAGERAILLRPEYKHLHNLGDWEKLTPEQQKAIEKLACIKFNRLSDDIKGQLSSLTEAQFLQLPPEDRKKFIELIDIRVRKKGTAEEKAHFAEFRKKAGQITNLKEIKILLKAFQRLFEVKERVFLYSALQEKFTYVKLGPKELQEMIKALESDYKKLQEKSEQEKEPKYLLTKEAIEIKTTLDWLRSQQENLVPAVAPAVAAPIQPAIRIEAPKAGVGPSKPLDIAHIQSEVGAHVGKGAQTVGYYGIGGLARIAGWSVGGIGWAAGNVLGYLSEPSIGFIKKWGAAIPGVLSLPDSIKWIEPVMQMAALGVNISAMLASPMISKWLQDKGIPLAAADEFIREKIVFGLPNAAAFVAHGAHSAGSYLVERTDEAVGGMLRVHEHIQQAAQAPALGDQMVQQIFKASAATQDFTKAVAEVCATPDASALKLCSSTVYSYFVAPLRWEELAKIAGVQKGSPAFYAVLEKMARTGVMPAASPATGVASQAAEFGSAIASTVYEGGMNAAKSASNLAGKALGMVDSTFESVIGKAYRDGLVETVRLGSTGIRELTRPITNAVAASVESASTMISGGAATVQSAAAEATRVVKETVGLEQALPEDVKKAFDLMVKGRTELLQLSTREAICRKSALLLDDMRESYLGSMALSAAANPDVTAALQGVYVDQVSPMFHNALSTFKGLVLVSEASKKYLETTMKAQDSVEKSLEGFFVGYQEEALKALQKEQPSVGKGIAVGLGAVSTMATVALGVTGATSILFPLLYGRILPHLLREGAGPIARGAQPFWYSLAAQSFGAADSTGKKAQEFIASLSSYGQALLGRFYIDQMRIDNFMSKLSQDEQNHLYDLVISAKKLSPQEIEAFKALRATPQNKMTKEIRESLALTALRNFQQLASYELMSLSPTSYSTMDQRTQERVIEVVEKYEGLTAKERGEPHTIVEKFSKLSEAQKKEIEDMTLSEYGELSADQQEDIRFLAAHSASYKARKAPGKTDILWEHGEFRKVASISNKELGALLPLYSRLSVEERALITPSRLRKMSLAKVQHLLQIVKTYHPELIYEVSKASKGALNLDSLPGCYAHRNHEIGIRKQKERLLEVLATVFNKLPAQQRAQAILLTEGEYNSYSPAEKKRLLSYLITAPELKSEQAKLQQQLLQLEKNEWIDVKYIAAAFNRLQPAHQTECRTMHELGQVQQESLNESLEKELASVTVHLAVLTKASKNKKEVHFLAHTLEIKKLKAELEKPLGSKEKALKEKELAVKKAELDQTIDVIKGYEAEIYKQQQQKQALEILLKKVPPPNELDVEPESMESRAIHAAANAIASDFIETELQGKYKLLEANRDDASRFKPLAQSLVLDLTSRVDIIKKKIVAAGALVEKMKSAIRNPKISIEDRIRTREELRVLRTFWLPAYELQRVKFEEGLNDLKRKIQEIDATRAKAPPQSLPEIDRNLRYRHRSQNAPKRETSRDS